jgi:hypothetical protein
MASNFPEAHVGAGDARHAMARDGMQRALVEPDQTMAYEHCAQLQLSVPSRRAKHVDLLHARVLHTCSARLRSPCFREVLDHLPHCCRYVCVPSLGRSCWRSASNAKVDARFFTSTMLQKCRNVTPPARLLKGPSTVRGWDFPTSGCLEQPGQGFWLC